MKQSLPDAGMHKLHSTSIAFEVFLMTVVKAQQENLRKNEV
jgi:hypothetical protein